MARAVTLTQDDGGLLTVLVAQRDVEASVEDEEELVGVLVTFVVPKGTEHKPSSPGGAILTFEPSGTSSTGDRHDGDIPDHVDSTTGHAL